MNITKEDLSEAEMIHMFDQYDMPLYFINRMKNGDLQLNYYIDEIKGERKEIWFMSIITEEELKKILEQRVSSIAILTELYKSERLYYCTIPYGDEDDELKIEMVTPENFDNDAFPRGISYADYDYLNN